MINDNGLGSGWPQHINQAMGHSQVESMTEDAVSVFEDRANDDGESVGLQIPVGEIFLEDGDQLQREALLLLAWSLLLYRGSIEGQTEESIVFWGSYSTPFSSEFRPHYAKEANIHQIISSHRGSVSLLLSQIQLLCRLPDSDASRRKQEFVMSFATEESPIAGAFALDVKLNFDRVSITKPKWATLLSPEMAQFQIQGYADILRLLLENKERTVTDLVGTLGEGELARLWQWNSIVPPAISRCMHDIIGEKMAEHPEKPAVISWDGELTYGQLDRISSYLAEQLGQSGVEIGTVVPLCFEKSIWTVVALLAVMRTGGTFVLTDPQQPGFRLSTIVSEVDARILLTSQKQATLGAQIAPHAKIVVVGPDLLQFGEQAGHAVFKAVPPATLLYIVFTSGSTGKPKGVMISHENFTTGAIPRAEAVGYKPHSRVLDFPSYAFDVSIDCMLCTLANGGCICVPSDEQRVNDLGGAIQSMNVNMAHMTPSVARILSVDTLTQLEVLGLGGESLSSADAAVWGKATKIIIAYGPSECTVGCAINNDIDTSRSYTSIGRGVGGVTWIVDPDDHDVLTPVGAVGELLIEGSIVGLGYLKEPEKTREAFITDPKWLTAGSGSIPGRHGLLYKTGDLVRYDPAGSGNLVFVGRKDRQVKLRGQRVELGEIEYHLGKRLPQEVRIAAEVITPGGKGCEPSLVAFISEHNDMQTAVGDRGDTVAFSKELLRSLATTEKYLASELPAYMIPTAYIPLRSMPLLISCKVDRKKLQEIGLGLTSQILANFRTKVSQNAEPGTEAEQALQKIWNEVLTTETDIHVNDNFFALGGDSLKAMKLVATARVKGLSLTVAQIFANPTLKRMALIAERVGKAVEKEVPSFSLISSDWAQEEACEAVAALCKLTRPDIEDVYPCTPLQEGLMALSAKVSDAYIAQRVVHLADLGTAHSLKAAWEAVTSICPILRTRLIQVPRRGLMQVVVAGQLGWSSGNDLEEYLRQDRDSPMELGDALARFGLIVEQDGKSHIVLTIHHALYDGWMMPLIIDRVNKVYQGLAIPTTTPFKNFIKYIVDKDRKGSEDFWREQLHEANGLQFPVIPHPRYQPKADSLLEHRVEFPMRLASNTTIATSIRAAWGLVAARYTSSEDAVFGETITGRNASVAGIWEIEGPLITTVPMRVHANRTMLVSEYLQNVHEQTILRIPHEHMGLQHIRRLNADTLKACELRTGLVLHPNTDDSDKQMSTANDSPADGFAPINDKEAAQEALKFNSYALMLVCSLDQSGFLIMASFDANIIDKILMQKVLEEFGRTVQELCSVTTKRISDLLIMQEPNPTELLVLSKSHPYALLPYAQHKIQCTPEDIKRIWIADPGNPQCLLPVGAVGELLLETVKEQPLVMIDRPCWLLEVATDGDSEARYLYKSGCLGKYSADGAITLLGAKEGDTDADSSRFVQNTDPIMQPEPKTGRSLLLSQLWSRILNISEDDISPEADFFALGGDSIGAMKLVSEARLENMDLTVAQVFQHRQLDDMAHILKDAVACDNSSTTAAPFSLLDLEDVESFISREISPVLANPTWKIKDIVPCRPMQEIAVRGTTQLPRFSVRYELFYLEGVLDRDRLFKSCQELISRNEILRTIFTTYQSHCLGVVLERLDVPLAEYAIEGDLQSFVTKLCDLDVQTKMPEGAPFIKFFFVQGEHNHACLLMRISHAQYDEICLPRLLHQLAAIYEGKPVPETLPFSQYVYHSIRDSIPSSVPYWRNLLEGSSMTTLRPSQVLLSKKPAAISTTIDISNRLKAITTATLPTAAWALCLARRLSLRDVTFGEVVSGRNVGFPNCDMVMGPTWQYVPVRVKFQDDWSAIDLLEFIQQQHIDTSRFEAIGLPEIVRDCTEWPETVDWFDSVVHQDVYHVENLPFSSANSRMETVYPHPEPLREWKIQAFCKGESLTLEIVTYEDWVDVGTSILNELRDCMEQLVNKPNSALFEPAGHGNASLHISDTLEVGSVPNGGAVYVSA